MSIKIMSAVWEGDLADVYEVAVMLALANHCDDEGRCFPSTKRIAQLVRCSERKVRLVVKDLSDRGYIRVDQNAGPKGCNVFYLYPSPPAQRAPLHDVHPCTPRQYPLHTVPSPPAQCAAEPSKKHQRNPARGARAREGTSEGRGGDRKRGDPKPRNDGDAVAFWAEKISEGVYVAPSAISAGMAQKMLRSGMVTEQQLRAAGVY
ncbi:helix-turn-helix domain-containing protein [Thioclava sp. BHET1]|nr:helix-turn-helix domain-containing protein [Thioclava sp. BHET1]